PAIGNPVGIFVGRVRARATGKTNDDLYAELLRKQHRVTKSPRVARGVLLVGMDRISMAAQRGDLNILVVELLPPGFQLGVVREKLLDRAVLVAGISAGANLDGLGSEARIFIDKLIGREIRERGIEDADRNLATRPSFLGFARALGSGGGSQWCRPRNRAGQRSAGRGKKTSASRGKEIRTLSHEDLDEIAT